MKPEIALSRITYDNIMLSFKTNAIGPILVCQRFMSLLERAEASTDASGSSSEVPAVIANISARVGSITDNGLGGWYSYR
jgi:NAD(P)-dependent dehydrogenase (short-subunit alcohol dehydrogenase family)